MSDCCSAPGLMPFADAKYQLLNQISPVTDVDSVEIESCLGRVLAQDVTSSINVPGHDNSAMDGYALCDSSLGKGNGNNLTEFTMVGAAFAGQPYTGELKHGECIRIMTGAMVPDSANAVIMQEKTQASDAQIKILSPVKVGNCIRRAGEDIAMGETVLTKGTVLSSANIGLLASSGIAKVSVYRKIRVAIFSTGDELKQPGEALSSGDIYDSNKAVIKSMLTKLGAQVIDLGIIPDTRQGIHNAFVEADKLADVVISSGGVSVGDADYTKEVLDELGQINFWKVAMKPGKPFAFGLLPDSYFFGLPGNPVSATVTFHQLGLPGLQKLSGTTPTNPLTFKARLTDSIKKSPGRMDFQRGLVTNSANGELEVEPLGHQGSGVLSSMSTANCYLVLASETGNKQAGEWVDIEMISKAEL